MTEYTPCFFRAYSHLELSLGKKFVSTAAGAHTELYSFSGRQPSSNGGLVPWAVAKTATDIREYFNCITDLEGSNCLVYVVLDCITVGSLPNSGVSRAVHHQTVVRAYHRRDSYTITFAKCVCCQIVTNLAFVSSCKNFIEGCQRLEAQQRIGGSRLECVAWGLGFGWRRFLEN